MTNSRAETGPEAGAGTGSRAGAGAGAGPEAGAGAGAGVRSRSRSRMCGFLYSELRGGMAESRVQLTFSDPGAGVGGRKQLLLLVTCTCNYCTYDLGIFSPDS